MLNHIFLPKWIAKPCSLDGAILDWGKLRGSCTSHLADLRENCLVWVEMCSCRLAGWVRKFLQQTWCIFSAGHMISFSLCKTHMVLSYCHESLKGSIQSESSLNYQRVSTQITRLCLEEDLHAPRLCCARTVSLKHFLTVALK